MKNKLTGFNGFCCPNDKSANQYAIINHLKNYLMKNRKFDKKIAILRNQTSSAIFEIIYSYLQTYDNIIYIDANDVVNFFKKNHEKIAFTIVTTSTFLNNSTSLNKTILSECEKYSIPIHIDATQEFASLIVEDYNLNRKNLDISISLNVKNIIFYNLNICFYAWNSKKSLKFILTKCEIPTEFFKDYYDRLKMPDFLNNLLLHNGNKYLESKEEILKNKKQLVSISESLMTNDKNFKTEILWCNLFDGFLIDVIFNDKSPAETNFLVKMLYEKLNKKDNDYFSLVTIPYMNYYKNMICFKNFYPLSSYMKKKINTAFFNSLSDVIDLNHSREQLTCVNLEIDNKNLKNLLKIFVEYSNKGFIFQGSSLIWLKFSDYYRLPNDVDLLLQHKNFKNFDDKFLFFAKTMNNRKFEKYDYFNWNDNLWSVDLLLTNNIDDGFINDYQFEFNGNKYSIKGASLDYILYQKIETIISNSISNTGEFNCLKDEVIKDINFLLEKNTLLTSEEIKKFVSFSLQNSTNIYFKNPYKDIKNLVSKVDLTLYKEKVRKLIVEICNEIERQSRDEIIPNKDFQFDWR